MSKNAFTRTAPLCECGRSNLSLKMRHKTRPKGGWREKASCQCSQSVPASQQTCTFDRSLHKLNALCLSTKRLLRWDGVSACGTRAPVLSRPGVSMRVRSRCRRHPAKGEHQRRGKPLGPVAPSFPPPRHPPPRARAHRVGGVAGPERRQCEGWRRASPSSCPGDPGSGARGRLQRAAAVPCSACGEQRGEHGGQRSHRGGSSPGASPAPPPVLLQAEAIKS